MSRHAILRFGLPALIGIPAGFIALAVAAANEPSIPGPLLSIFSPGLKLAELLTTPAQHEPLGATFGEFLRVAIAANVAYYMALCALLARLLNRRSRRERSAHAANG
jgi:hypothetical protein